jgi:molybdopterin-guanine dinucleotide biosynthesis protein A
MQAWLALLCILDVQATSNSMQSVDEACKSMSDFILVVNAGGSSKRMHSQQKALLPVPPHDQPLVDYIVSRLAPLSTSGVVVVANDPAVRRAVAGGHRPPVEVVPDLWPEAGAMGGIATGLSYCREWAIAAACDMPFVDPGLFELLCQFSGELDSSGRRLWDAVVPRVRGYPQMLHTLYHVDALPIFRRLIQAGDLKLLNVLRDVRVRYVGEDELASIDPELRSFTNVNTLEEWDWVLKELGRLDRPHQ